LTAVTAINDQFALRSNGTVRALPSAPGACAAPVAGLTAMTSFGTTGSVALKADGSLWPGRPRQRRPANLPAAATAAQGNWPCWPDCGNAFSILTVTR
jgi:hypothetical protein